MARYMQCFNVEREIDGELTELDLEVECEAEPFVPGRLYDIPERCYPDEGGFAVIDCPIYIVNEDGKRVLWDGTLTKDEESRVEESAYINWCNLATEEEPDYSDDEEDYVDLFHDDRAISTVNGGKVYY